MIQISDFSLHILFDQEEDVHGFTRIFSEIVLGASCQRSGHAGEIPSFVSKIIKRGQCINLKAVDSCKAILNILKQNHFKIVEGTLTE
jgi:hypothetical protein